MVINASVVVHIRFNLFSPDVLDHKLSRFGLVRQKELAALARLKSPRANATVLSRRMIHFASTKFWHG